MNHLRHFANAGAPVETCVVGSGGFGRSFIVQSLRAARRCNLVSTRIAVDREAEIAAAALRSAGVAEQDIAICETATQALAAWERGQFIAAADLAVVVDLPFDVVVEATGHPEAGARHGRLAIEAGRHIALASKEVDSVIGPELARRARERGKVVTPVDGDQPSLLIGLVTWAQALGFEILAAGKSSEYDFVYDEAAGTMTCNGITVAVADFDALWDLGQRDVPAVVQARAQACQALPQRAVPDLCELLVVANATGLLNDTPALHAPIARVAEVPTMFGPRLAGGLLARPGTLDVFHCLRRPDEISFAGGVFVIVACEDKETWDLLAGKGHLLSRDGARAMVWLPRHLLGLEAATSVLDAAAHGQSSGAEQPRPRLDLIAVATEPLAAGSYLHMSGHHHSIRGTTAHLVPAGPLGAGQPLPFYLAANRRLVRDVAAGTAVCLDDVEIASQSELLALRQAQDAAFFVPAR